MQYPPVQSHQTFSQRVRNLTQSRGVETHGLRVGLKPEKGWARRNYHFWSKALIPTMLKRRDDAHFDLPPEFRELTPNEVEVTWIGHASFLVRTHSHNILIDPNWALWMGPVKRTRHPGIRIDHLPRIDMILISHAHMDHLHRPTLRQVANGQTVLVPKGVSGLMRGLNFSSVRELELWEHYDYEHDLEIILTPAFHWGARFLHDTHRGFGGFILRNQHASLFHCGDSAYFEGFADIGKRYHIDTALMPIGAYDAPSGREVHMNPEEALQAFEDLGAKQMIPMHHDTFPLGMGKRCEPLRRLNQAAASRNLGDRVLTPREGEPVILSH